MYDSGKIIIGLILFVGLFTSPFWYDSLSKTAMEKPDLILPAKDNQKQCVESAGYMLSNHMKLLNEWRNDFVRNGITTYTSSDGKKYEISLENSCLGCHSNTTQFCDRCHSYLAVSLTCWSCHTEARNLSNLQDIKSAQFKKNLKKVLTGRSGSRETENIP